MSSIFERAAKVGKVVARTPFLDVKGIYKVRIDSVRSGENQSHQNYVAIDVEIKEFQCPDPNAKFLVGDTRSIMSSEPKDRKHEGTFYNTLVTWGVQIARALWAQGGKEGPEPKAEDIDANILQALFGPESLLVNKELTVEAMPRQTKNGATVYNYVFSV